MSLDQNLMLVLEQCFNAIYIYIYIYIYIAANPFNINRYMSSITGMALLITEIVTVVPLKVNILMQSFGTSTPTLSKIYC